MSFWQFQDWVLSMLERSGSKMDADFSQEKGQHIAHCGGIIVIGNRYSRKVTVKWGDRHTAIMEV